MPTVDTTQSKQPSTEQSSPPQKPYETPVLTQHGSVEELTQINVGGSGNPD